MRITALIENTCQNNTCQVEHGLSLYIETKKHTILFDTGQSGVFLENADNLNISLQNIDLAVLSHGHFDHGGGLSEFMKVNKVAPIYINRYAFREHYNAKGKYIGLDRTLYGNGRIVMTDDELVLDEELRLFTYNDREGILPIRTFGMTEKVRETEGPDSFRHEQYLLIKEDEKTVLISGCSHKGIINIMDWTKEENLSAVVGGFHFFQMEPDQFEQLDEQAEYLMKYPVDYYTCHCTGTAQYDYLKAKMGDTLHYIACGDTIEL